MLFSRFLFDLTWFLGFSIVAAGVASVNSIFIGSSNEIGSFESGLAAKLMGLIPSVIFGGGMTLLVVTVTAKVAPMLRKLDLRNLTGEKR